MINTQLQSILNSWDASSKVYDGVVSVTMDTDEMSPTIKRGDSVAFSAFSEDIRLSQMDVVIVRAKDQFILRRFRRNDHGLVVTLSDDHTRLGVFGRKDIVGVMTHVTRANGSVISRGSLRWALLSLTLPFRSGLRLKAIRLD